MMPYRRLLSFLFLAFTVSLGYGQTTDSIYIDATPGSDNPEINILFAANDIHYYKLKLGQNQKRKGYILITLKTYWKGELTETSTLISPANAKQLLDLNKLDSTTTLMVYTQSKEDSLKYTVKYRNVSVSGMKKRINSEQYSLRFTQLSPGKTLAIPTDTTLPLLVYALPYVDPAQPNIQQYCELTAEGVPPEDWWNKYKVEHYIIFEFTFVTESDK